MKNLLLILTILLFSINVKASDGDSITYSEFKYEMSNLSFQTYDIKGLKYKGVRDEIYIVPAILGVCVLVNIFNNASVRKNPLAVKENLSFLNIGCVTISGLIIGYSCFF
jgi:hypothetical protein